MNYYQFRSFDISNGPGTGASLFLCGCNIKCPGCFNKELQDFNAGKPFTEEVKTAIEKHFFTGDRFSILGGEPTQAFSTFKELYPLINLIAWMQLQWAMVVLYTGRTLTDDVFKKDIDINDNVNLWKLLIRKVNYVVDGPFVEKLKDPNLLYRGSSNQRIINVNDSLEQEKIVTIDEKDWNYENFRKQFD